jgi:hypothetical protein
MERETARIVAGACAGAAVVATGDGAVEAGMDWGAEQPHSRMPATRQTRGGRNIRTFMIGIGGRAGR